jgi:hypothetical protein
MGLHGTTIEGQPQTDRDCLRALTLRHLEERVEDSLVVLPCHLRSLVLYGYDEGLPFTVQTGASLDYS